METLSDMTQLSTCHICKSQLQKHPLYPESVAKICRKHGDFFLQQQNGKPPVVVFRALRKNTTRNRRVAKKPTVTKAKKSPVGRSDNCQTIRCDQTGVIYHSQGEAARSLKLSQSNICQYLKGKRKSINGYTFTRMIDDGRGGLKPILRVEMDGGRKPIPVRCEETGMEFESIRQASRALGLNRGNFYYALRGGTTRKKVGGYTFTKINLAEKT